MPESKCIIILSEKSSGSSACQNLLARIANVQHARTTRHFENETLYWTKAASILGRPQIRMVDSEVPIPKEKARADLISLLTDNLDHYSSPKDDTLLVMDGWKRLCAMYSPIFLEKSPHHLCQWSAIELILEFMKNNPEISFLLIGLIRNPMDTIYSQYKRWGSSPKKVQEQWRIAYENLEKLKNMASDATVILRYEDMASSISHMEKVFDFCGVSVVEVESGYLHQNAIQKWKHDPFFGFSLSRDVADLAERYGYQADELTNKRSRILWPLICAITRAKHFILDSPKLLARKAFKKTMVFSGRSSRKRSKHASP